MRLAVIFLTIAPLLSAVGCGGGTPDAPADGKPVVYVSIQPLAFLVDRISAGTVTVRTLVKPGQDPHTFEPTPKDMVELSRAALFLHAGTPFEEVIVSKLAGIGAKRRIVDVTEGIDRHPEDEHHDGVADDHGGDAHVWMSPRLMKQIAQKTCDALCELLPENEGLFVKLQSALNGDLHTLHRTLQITLAPLKGKTFFVFHPAFGYFADEYGLVQESVEVGGKSPSAKHIQELVEKARAQNVKVIFVQPQFSKQAADSIARQIGGVVVPLDPLARDYIANMKRIADEIGKSMKSK